MKVKLSIFMIMMLMAFQNCSKTQFASASLDQPNLQAAVDQVTTVVDHDYQIDGKILDVSCGAKKAIAGVVVSIAIQGSNEVLESAITDVNGYFSFERKFNSAETYVETWSVPDQFYSEAEYKKVIDLKLVANYENLNSSNRYSLGGWGFIKKGINYSIVDSITNKPISGASVRISNASQVLVATTDAEGCVHLPSTDDSSGEMMVSADHYSSYSSNIMSGHTLIGGMSLSPLR